MRSQFHSRTGKGQKTTLRSEKSVAFPTKEFPLVKRSLLFSCLLIIVLTVPSASAQYGETKITPTDGSGGDHFGNGVSLSGGYALVGAYWDSDSVSLAGSAYIFQQNGGLWIEGAKLIPSDPVPGGWFGWVVSLWEDRALVGGGAGSAYIFHRLGTMWLEEAKVTSSDGEIQDLFGSSVSISGDYLLVGARGDDDLGSNSGSAYVFRRDGSAWIEETKLTASDGAVEDWFGVSVSLCGDRAVIGAFLDDDNGAESGSVYVFRREGSIWVEETKLLAADGSTEDFFGMSVSLSPARVIIGADGDDDNGSSSGSAYVFRREGTTWIEEAKLTASDGTAGDVFGSRVSLDGDSALVGAWGDDENGMSSGAAYVFRHDGIEWIEDARLTPSDGSPSAYFGGAVSISGGTILVGADGESQNGSGYIYSPAVTGLEEQSAAIAEFTLMQNYPNPFNPQTTIRYGLPVRSTVRLEVFNVLGHRVATLVNEIQEPGYNAAQWQHTVASGVYFYRIDATSLDDPSRTFTEVRKMLMVK